MNSATSILKTAFPGRAQKSLATGVGCSMRQAKRMLVTGKIPSEWREAVVRLVDQGLDLQLEILKAAKNGVRESEFEIARMAQRRVDRHENRQRDTDAARSIKEAAQLALTLPENGEGR